MIEVEKGLLQSEHDNEDFEISNNDKNALFSL